MQQFINFPRSYFFSVLDGMTHQKAALLELLCQVDHFISQIFLKLSITENIVDNYTHR